MLPPLCSLALALLTTSFVTSPPDRPEDHVLDEGKIDRASLLGTGDSEFGTSLAALGDLNGDGIDDLAAGVPYDDDGGNSRGAVWVLFLSADGTVDHERKISDTTGGLAGELDDQDWFGTSLAALGDLDQDGIQDLAVGAPRDDDGGTDRGAVWILFLNRDGTVKSEQKISSTAGGFTGVLDPGDRIADSLAGLGDLDGDGISDLAVGAISDDGAGYDRGGLWILFLRADGTVKSHQRINDVEGGFGGLLDDRDHFGSSLASLGDLDGDGVVELAVGATGDDDGGWDNGAVWILFLDTDGTVRRTRKISAKAGGFHDVLDAHDEFGSSVAGLGDLNGDGVRDLAVGATGDDDGEYSSGAVWILFLYRGGAVRSEQKISATAGGFAGSLDLADRFGASIAVPGDLDGDGIPEVAVGASYDDEYGPDAGSAWLLLVNGDGTVDEEKRIGNGSGWFDDPLADDDRFAAALTSAGDLNGDGVQDLFVGLPGKDTGGSDRGEARILLLSPDELLIARVPVRRMVSYGDGRGGFPGSLHDGDVFGTAVARAGDLDGDGRCELVVGAPGDDDGGGERGATWILFADDHLEVRTATKISDAAGGLVGPLDDGDRFGSSATALADLDGDGRDELVVGAPGDDDGGADRGAVWILFLHANGTVRVEHKISATAGGFAGALADGDSFGSAVAAVGDFDGDGIEELAVGAPGADGAGVDRGAVWLLFLGPTGAVRRQRELTTAPGFPTGSLSDGDHVGAALGSGADLDGDGIQDLVVGAPGSDDGGLGRGAVWSVLLHPTEIVWDALQVSGTAGGFGGDLLDGDGFGSAVASVGDLDEDGHEDLMVGAPGDDDGGTDVGAAWLLFCDHFLGAQARAVWRNGSGVNPDVFTSTSLPVLGTDWTSTVDGGALGAVGLVAVFGYGGLFHGLMTPAGEVLLDPFSEYAFSDWGTLGSGTTSHHVVSIPVDPAFLGVRVTTQALLNNVGGAARLTNAWDLVLGY